MKASRSSQPSQQESSDGPKLILHSPGAPALRLGLGPGCRPVGAIRQLRNLLDQHSFWATGRSDGRLKQMLQFSQAAVTAWDGDSLVGFSRATSDGIYRAVLWDVVINTRYQRQGLGRRLVSQLLEAPRLRNVERIYLMTTNSEKFYERLGFERSALQKTLVKISEN